MADLVWPLANIGIGIIIVLIGIVFIVVRLRDKRSGVPAQDERTLKINGMAARYALYIGLYFMLGIMFVDIIGREFFSIPELDAGPVIIASILVFSITNLVFQLYFDKKRDHA